MKTVLGMGLGLVMLFGAHTSYAQVPVAKMTDQLLSAQSQGATRSTANWNGILKRYGFTAPTPLSDIRPAPGLQGYTITHTMYGAEDETFPSVFVVYKGDAIVAFLGLENRANEAVTTTDGYPIAYTAAGKALSAQEKKSFETWFYTWLNSVN